MAKRRKERESHIKGKGKKAKKEKKIETKLE